MKRLLYVSYANYKKDTDLGVIKKISGQKDAFRCLGYEIDEVKMEGNFLLMNDEVIFNFRGKLDYWVKLPLKIFLFFFSHHRFYDLVYVRKDFYTPLYLPFFIRLSKISKYILLEVPTFPYKRELKRSFFSPLVLLIDRVTFLLIKRIVYRIVTTQGYDKILGVKTIKIRNGYDFSNKLNIRREKPKRLIQLISVANFNSRHGIDRLLYGLKEYQSKYGNDGYEFVLNLVGIGEELERYSSLVQKLKLQNMVEFHGAKHGEDLQKLYIQSDIGVGSLGLYRSGLTFTSSLKNMEYCYYGLPFIIGNYDEDLDRMEFVLKFSNDDTPICIDEILKWFFTLKVSACEIQRVGEHLFSWEEQIKIVLESIT